MLRTPCCIAIALSLLAGPASADADTVGRPRIVLPVSDQASGAALQAVAPPPRARTHARTGALLGALAWAAVCTVVVAEGGWEESGVVSWPSAALLGASAGAGALIGSRLRADDPLPRRAGLEASFSLRF